MPNPTDSVIEYIPADYLGALPIDVLFPRIAPLEVDVGCGEGSFLVEMARRFPDRNFLGIERLLGRIRKTTRRTNYLHLKNVRLLRLESAYAVRYLLPPASVSVFHVMFPDPWPKRKHHRRRLVNDSFLDAIHAALDPAGELRLTTDDPDYFTWMKRFCLPRKDFTARIPEEDPDYPQTDFEKGFRAQGLPIYRLYLRKI